MVQIDKSGRTFRIGPGPGLSFSKYFGPAYKTFCVALIATIFFFRDVDPLCSPGVTSVSEVIVIFLHLILFANTAAFFHSLLGLASHYFSEGDNGEEIREMALHRQDQSLTRFLACF